MRDDELRYLSWTKTGPFLLAVGLVMFVLFIIPLIGAIRDGSAGMVAVCALFIVAALYNIAFGVRLVRSRRSL